MGPKTFLQLPSEIRNLIYKYALTSDIPLHAKGGRTENGHLAVEINPPRDVWVINQLKGVNRQLRRETFALEYQYNLLMFNSVITYCNDAIMDLLHFLMHLPDMTKPLTAIIYPNHYMGDYIYKAYHFLENLDSVCQRFPQLTVIYMCLRSNIGFGQDVGTEHYIREADMVSRIVRGVPLEVEYPRFADGSTVESLMESWRKENARQIVEGRTLKARNLKFYPLHCNSIDGDGWCGPLESLGKPSEEEGKKWIKILKDWGDHGF